MMHFLSRRVNNIVIHIEVIGDSGSGARQGCAAGAQAILDGRCWGQKLLDQGWGTCGPREHLSWPA